MTNEQKIEVLIKNDWKHIRTKHFGDIFYKTKIENIIPLQDAYQRIRDSKEGCNCEDNYQVSCPLHGEGYG